MRLTGTVLVIVLITKFTHGAWIVVDRHAGAVPDMEAIHRHYERVTAELRWPGRRAGHAAQPGARLVLVSKIHKPTLRALSYARATRPSSARGGHGDVDDDATAG